MESGRSRPDVESDPDDVSEVTRSARSRNLLPDAGGGVDHEDAAEAICLIAVE